MEDQRIADFKIKFTQFDLSVITNEFSDANYVGDCQHGKVYRGKLDGPIFFLTPPLEIFNVPSLPPGVNFNVNGVNFSGVRFDNLIWDEARGGRGHQHGMLYNGPTLPPLFNRPVDKSITDLFWRECPPAFTTDLPPKDVIVKIRRSSTGGPMNLIEQDMHCREVDFLHRYPHPMVMEMLGFCSNHETQLAIVYDFKSMNTVHNLIESDDFTWSRRMNVALKLAQFLSYIKNLGVDNVGPLLIRNICAAHIMLDEDWNPKIYDFGMITTGMHLLDEVPYGPYGYCEPSNIWCGYKSDVYSFGVVLLCLMTKTVDKEITFLTIPVAGKCRIKYVEGMMSLLHESFGAHEGPIVTRIAMNCTEVDDVQRPTIEEVIDELNELEVVRRLLD